MPGDSKDFFVPDANYTRDSFQQFLIDNPQLIFLPRKKRKWIKIHGVRTRAGKWQELLEPHLKRRLGHLWHIGLPLSGTRRAEYAVDFYVCNYTPELLLFYTASTNWEYERSLRRFIENTIGLGQMWIGPKRFEGLILHFVDEFNPTVERFFARRGKGETLAAKVERDVTRRIDWGAEDSFETFLELRERYGVRPTSVLMRLKDGKIQLNNDGMFVLTRVNQKMFQAFETAMSFMKEEEALITMASQMMKLDFQKVGATQGELVVPELTSGSIRLNRLRLEGVLVERIMKNSKFDFIDTTIEEGSFSWIATAVDKEKKSVFGVNSDEQAIHLIPRFNITFESFLDFYRQILEQVDPTAVFQTPGGVIGR